MNKYDFMEMVKDIVENVETKDLDKIAIEMKGIINQAIEIEKMYDKAGIR